jgi:hypothetical protein
MAGATAACRRAGTVKFTSRILDGLMARRGLVGPRERIGCHAVFLARNRAKAFFPSLAAFAIVS